MDEQVIKLALSVFGVEGIVKLREESARLKLGMEAAAESFGKGETSAAEFSKATNAYARDLAKVNDLLDQFERAQAAQAAETSRTTAAIANQSGTASAWGAVMASAGAQARAATDTIRDQAATLAKGTGATQAWASAVTGASTAASGWGAVMRSAADSSAEAARKIEAETAALKASEAAAARASEASRSLVITTDQAATAHKKLADSSDKAKGGMAGFGQSALQTGRIVQDFQAAGVMGIANNLEGLALALGGGPGLAGALTLAAVAYLAFKPQLVEFYNTLTGGSNKVPEAADALKRLEDRLKKVGDELDKLKEKQSLSNSELARFTELTKEQDAIEKQKEAAAAQKAANEALAKARPEQQAADEKASAEGFTKAIAGRQEESIAALAEGLRLANQAAVTKAIARANVAEPGSEASRAALKDVAYYQKRSADDAEALEANRNEVRDLMARIGAEGKGADVSRAKSLMGFVPPEQRPAALSLGLENATVEGREKIRKWIEDTEKGFKDLADDALMMSAEADKRAAANRAVDAAMARNRELAKGAPVVLPPEPTRPAPVPRLVTPAQRRLAAAKQKRDLARVKKQVVRETKAAGPSGGMMRAPKGFRAGIPQSVTRQRTAGGFPGGPMPLMPPGMGQGQGGGAGLGMLGQGLQKGAQLQAKGNALDMGLMQVMGQQNTNMQMLGGQMQQMQQGFQRVMRDTNVTTRSLQRLGR